jgi:hypothetical protein
LEALQELNLARQAWLEAAKAEGKPIPPPTYRPIIYQLTEETPAIRKLLLDTASNPGFYLGRDKYQTDWYAQTLSSGEQVWVQVRTGEIRNAGVNSTPRVWQPGIGLVESP